jgi:nucleoside-diphosphate-sugar epimerase
MVFTPHHSHQHLQRYEQILTPTENTHTHPANLARLPPLPTPHHAYSAAKAQSMTYLSSLSPAPPFSIVQIIPGTVIGTSSARTRSVARAAMDRQSRALLFDDATPRYAFGFVHAADCAAVHIEALDEAKVPVDQIPPFFIAAHAEDEGVDGESLWARAVDVLERDLETEIAKGVFKIGRSRVPVNMPFRADSRRTEATLLDGRRMRGLGECVLEVARWYLGLEEDE